MTRDKNTNVRAFSVALAALVGLFGIAAAAPAQTFTLSGTFEYEDKAWSYNGWTGSDPILPIRRADVTVLDDVSSAILAEGWTDDNGDFSIPVTVAGLTDIIVRCDADTRLIKLATGVQRVRVTSETNVEYSVFSPVFAGHNPAGDLDIGTVTALKITSGGEEANAFNMLDMGVRAGAYIAGPDIGDSASASTMRLFWPGGSGSFASGNGAHMAEDDGYDDAVILHELGHVVHNLYSDSDSPGGSHVFGDSDQDPRLSLGEGFATFWAGAVFDSFGVQAIYMDANGASQSGGVGLRARLETTVPYSGDSYGAADELAVACTLFDIVDDETSPDQSVGIDDDLMGSGLVVDGKGADEALWEVFTGPVASASNLTINDFWDGWFSEHGADPKYTEIQSAYENRRCRFWEDDGEPNNSQGTALFVPFETGSGWGPERTLYDSSGVGGAAPGSNDRDWYAVDLVEGSTVTWKTRYPGNAGDADTQTDAYLEVYAPSGGLVASDESSGNGNNASIADFVVSETGTWTYLVKTNSSWRRYGRYEVRTRMLTENTLPTILSGPIATPDTIDDDQTTTLSVSASDPDGGQTLSYTWTPLDGGTILGSGSSVSFDPPSVVATSVLRIELVVEDNLGADLPPVEVTVTVNPAAGSTCLTAANVVSGGVGKPGLFGVPVLSADNLPVVPSADFVLRGTNLHPLLTGNWIIGFSMFSAPFDGGTMYPTPDLLLPVVVPVSGEVSLPILVPDDPIFCGLPVHVQLMVAPDSGATGFKQTAQTNFLTMTFGN